MEVDEQPNWSWRTSLSCRLASTSPAIDGRSEGEAINKKEKKEEEGGNLKW